MTHEGSTSKTDVAHEAVERFWAKVSKGDDGSCWPWVAAVDVSGYGQFRWRGKKVLAHRFAYELVVGDIPDGLVIDHLCDRSECVNPRHLEPVTQRENIRRGHRRRRQMFPEKYPTVDLPDGVNHGTRYAYVGYACRCVPCTDENSEYQVRARVRLSQTASDTWQHGSESTYTNYGCRCDGCTAAQSANSVAYRRDRWVRLSEYAAAEGRR